VYVQYISRLIEHENREKMLHNITRNLLAMTDFIYFQIFNLLPNHKIVNICTGICNLQISRYFWAICVIFLKESSTSEQYSRHIYWR